ncbi:hypothetical protein [Parasitella parasitica]|uniref:Choice-of-anchor A domain-containing protein n=1 Tax=Parasitella parasitica TaxID=35722 RepID=A0A0B7NN64_9FUNG|nr:hypothetical protein [Parasitella parasitica]
MKITLVSAFLTILPFIELSHCQAVNPNEAIPKTQCIEADQDSTSFHDFMNHFTGIFYNDFVTNRGHAIFGPLAVGGKATIPSYSVDTRRLANCSSTDLVKRLGLYAKSLSSPATLHISGDIDVGTTPRFNTLVNENPKCKTLTSFDTKAFKFNEIWPSAIEMSTFLASQAPTHVLTSDGTVKLVHETQDQRFYIFQFGPCSSNGCRPGTDIISDASDILIGGSAWRGPNNGYPTARMIVFNVGVVAGQTISITTDRPSSGLSGCRVIYNFYPINTSTSTIDTTAEISINRLTNNKMEGLVMNLYGSVNDGPHGNFAGQLVGKSYKWINTSQGADIMNYEDDCYGKFGCWIPTNFTDPYSDLYTIVSTETDTTTLTVQTISYEVSTEYSPTTTETVTITVGENVLSLARSHSGFTITETDTATVTEVLENVLTLYSTSTESSDETTSTTTYQTSTNHIIQTSHSVNETTINTLQETTYEGQDTTTTTTTTESVYSVEEQTTATTTTIIQLVD